MVLMLVVAMLGGQVIYEWVDAKGQSHFTDDASTIPEGVSRRETRGGEFSVVPTARPAPPAPARAPAQPPVDTCAVAQQQLSEVEQQVAEASASAAQVQEQEWLRCQGDLRVFGYAVFAQCMAGRSEPLAPDDRGVKALEDARENLRRAQVSGCR